MTFIITSLSNKSISYCIRLFTFALGSSYHGDAFIYPVKCFYWPYFNWNSLLRGPDKQRLSRGRLPLTLPAPCTSPWKIAVMLHTFFLFFLLFVCFFLLNLFVHRTNDFTAVAIRLRPTPLKCRRNKHVHCDTALFPLVLQWPHEKYRSLPWPRHLLLLSQTHHAFRLFECCANTDTQWLTMTDSMVWQGLCSGRNYIHIRHSPIMVLSGGVFFFLFFSPRVRFVPALYQAPF